MTVQERNADTIATALLKAGCTAEGAAGVLGNLEAESGLYPCRMQGDFAEGFAKSLNYAQRAMTGALSEDAFANDGIGFGLAQWTYPARKRKLLNYAQAAGKFVGDIGIQTEFLIEELKHDFPSVWLTLCGDTSTRHCSNAMLLNFERPADMSLNTQEYRLRLSERWLNFLDGKGSINSHPEEETAQSGSESPTEGTAEKDTEATPYWPPRILCKGMLGCDVMLLQAALTCRGYGCTVDGIFGKGTEEKARAMQADTGWLDVDGIVGPKTWKALGVTA